MTLTRNLPAKQSMGIFAGLVLALALFPCGAAAQTESAESKPADTKPTPETSQTFYLTNLAQPNDGNDIQTDLRNMLPKARIYYVSSQGALTIHATAEDIQLAQKIIADLDRVKKIYRLTYTIADTDDGKRTGTQSFALVVASGSRTILKQGSRVPLVTGAADAASSTPNSQVQYQDVGLTIEASVDAYTNGLRLRTKVEQSSLADEKSGVGSQDPIFRQTAFDATSTLVPGKPLVLGAIGIPGTTRKQEIEVLAELVP